MNFISALQSQRRRRQGFTLLLLAVAAASICTVTVSTQSNSTLYEVQTMKQVMKTDQAKWINNAYQEIELGLACAPPLPGPTQPLPPPNTMVMYPSQLHYTNTPTTDPALVVMSRTPLAGGQTDIQIRVYEGSNLSRPPTVLTEIKTSSVALQPDPNVDSGQVGALRVLVKAGRHETGWQSN